MENIEYYKNKILSLDVIRDRHHKSKMIEGVLTELIEDCIKPKNINLPDVDKLTNEIWDDFWNPENQLKDDDDKIALIRKRIRKFLKKLR